MNHHYVPQFYLKNFSQNGKQIFVYDKVKQKSFSSSISSIASEHSFYENSKNESLENEIGKLESKIGVILKDIIDSLNSNSFTKISELQKKILIEFIWLQMNRTLESRIHFASLQPYLFSKLSDVPFDLDVSELLNRPGIKDDHINHLSSIKENSFAFEALGSRNFIVVRNKTNTEFLSSDEPVIRHLHWEIDHRMYEIFLPITPQYALWIFPKGLLKEIDDVSDSIYEIIDDQNIVFYNFHQIYRSTRQIFSFTGNFEFLKKVFKEDPDFGNLNKRRID